MTELEEQKNRIQFFNGPEFAQAMSTFLECFTHAAERTNLLDPHINDEDKASSGVSVRVATSQPNQQKSVLLVFKGQAGNPFGKYPLGTYPLNEKEGQ